MPRGVPGVLRCFLGLEAYQEGWGHSQGGGCWLQRWASCGLAWAAQASWNLGLVSGLAGVGEAVASGGASGGREGSADEASCRDVLLPPAVPGQVLPSAGVPAEGSARAAAVPSAVGLAAQRISATACGSSGAP